MRRFFLPNSDFSQTVVSLIDPKEVHHLLHVLRHKVADRVVLFNGCGEEAESQIAAVRNGSVELKILNRKKVDAVIPPIILACAIPKKSKFETIIEKATELGVTEIIPLQTQRTEVLLKGDRLTQRLTRYRNVALNAAKQSQRQTVPMINSVLKFSDAIERLKLETTMIIPSLIGNTQPILATLEKITRNRTISIFIGPEGDFTPAEYKHAFDMGCVPVSLGETILKVETAALCAVCSVAQYFYHARPTR